MDIVDTGAAGRTLLEVAFGAAAAGALLAAVRLGVADALGDEPAEAADLAARVRAEPGALDRLLRALSQHGIFAEVDTCRYAHTAASRMLREDAEGGLRYMVRWLGADWTWRAWPMLAEAVRRGECVVPDIFGKDFYAYLKEDAPDDELLFMRAMTQSSGRTSDAVVAALDLQGVQRVADIGGGQGHLLRRLLERYPSMYGVLFDLEAVTVNVDPALRRAPLSRRCEIVAGNFLRGVPTGADLYILKNIVEGPDESSTIVLGNIVAAAKAGTRVAIVSSLLETAPAEMKVTTAWDLTLLLNVGGQKHRASDLAAVISGSGLRLSRSLPVPGTFPTLHLFECVVPESGTGDVVQKSGGGIAAQSGAGEHRAEDRVST